MTGPISKPGGIPKAKGLKHPKARGKYEVVAAIPRDWEVAFLKQRGRLIVVAAHDDHTPRWSPLSKRMRPFQRWPKLTMQRIKKDGKEK